VLFDVLKVFFILFYCRFSLKNKLCEKAQYEYAKIQRQLIFLFKRPFRFLLADIKIRFTIWQANCVWHAY